MTESVYESLIRRLSNAKISSPRLEARLLLAAVTQKSADEINSTVRLSPNEAEQLETMLCKRLNHTPLDKILGYKAFYKYNFKVDDNVLSPRPDTEILLEAALKLMAQHGLKNVLDLGTGSGCILLSLLKEFPLRQGVGIDKSDKALAIARQNCQALGLESQCCLLEADWFCTDFKSLQLPLFDMIVSNPPYIPTADISDLEDDVRNHDPQLALDGGTDGFDCYCKIAELAPTLLADNGFILLEAGINQAQQIRDIFAAQGLKPVDILKDLAGIERCVILQKTAPALTN